MTATGDPHEDTAKNLFREPRLHLTLNNSVKNTIITAVSCLVESKSNMVRYVLFLLRHFKEFT